LCLQTLLQAGMKSIAKTCDIVVSEVGQIVTQVYGLGVCVYVMCVCLRACVCVCDVCIVCAYVNMYVITMVTCDHQVLVYDKHGQDIISPLMNVKELRNSGVTLHL